MMENKKKRNTGFLRWAIALMVIAAVMAFGVSPASAQNYPTKPLVLIVPYAPGGGSDIAARLIAHFVQPHLGQSIVVENKPGATGQVGWSAIAKARPDGYTIGYFSTPSILLVKMLHADVPFQISDFEYIANIQIDPAVIVVPPDSPFKTMNDLVEYAKKNPGKLNIGGDGPQSNYHLQAVVVEKQLGIKMNFVSYSGSGSVIPAVLGKQLDVGIPSISSAAPQIEEKRLRALALVDTEKFALLPGIPLIKAVTGVDISPIGASLRGIMIPKGVSADKIKVLDSAFAKLVKDPKFIEKAKETGIILKYMNGKQFSEALAKDEMELPAYINLLKK
jgi:tripartite-type tricarboxylate transporter receptor subunit TctC